MKKVVPLTIISEVVRIDTATTGRRIPASFRRGASLGKGAVGDKALKLGQYFIFIRVFLQTYLAKRSHPSAMSPTTCMTGLILVHIASSIGFLVLSC